MDLPNPTSAIFCQVFYSAPTGSVLKALKEVTKQLIPYIRGRGFDNLNNGKIVAVEGDLNRNA
jgi:hypothetical protein